MDKPLNPAGFAALDRIQDAGGIGDLNSPEARAVLAAPAVYGGTLNTYRAG